MSNILELELDSHSLTRVVAYKLEEMGNLELAENSFRRVLSLRPDEPQSYRDLALVLHKRGKLDEAIKLMHKVITGKWDERFAEIELIALVELNRMITEYRKDDPEKPLPINISEELIRSCELDLRIVMAWDTGMFVLTH